jgi:hypothetical protein
LGDRFGVRTGLLNLAAMAVETDDVPRAARLLDEARTAAIEPNDKTGLAYVLLSTADLEHAQESSEMTGSLYRQCLPLFQQLGDSERAAQCHGRLAILALEETNIDAAEAHLEASLALVRDLRHGVGLASCAMALAAIAQSRGEHNRAATLIGAADGLLSSANASLPPVERRLQKRIIAAASQRLAPETLDALLGEAKRLNFDEIMRITTTARNSPRSAQLPSTSQGTS